MRFWEFVLAALVAEITPGPNMGYLVALSLSRGRRAGMAAVAGVALGLALLGLAAAFGFAFVSERFPLAAAALRWGGVAYLFWLAWDAWREPDAAMAQDEVRLSFRRGLITNLLNPKAAVFYVAVIPLFLPVPPARDEILWLTATFVVIATAIHAALVLGADAARSLLFEPSRERLIRRGAAVGMALVALWFAWSTR
ncbi:LysE family translocator [Bosea sp. BK604]|uniref:LysE family translocator n=1 Tax=Bosea sp. BK604 TaxID=2512180 RepID=UPI0010526EAA|nr:LysE family translocator [Bosea sp. BK604]TCR63578.1 threonine/homoserine/homoserine lactone efflux protein [Bosea sp. BK604]